MTALERANDVRHRNAEYKRLLGRLGKVDGPLDAAATLKLDEPGHLGRFKIFELLDAIPGVGPVKADKILKRAGASPKTRVEDLSPMRREAIVGELRAVSAAARARLGEREAA